MPTDYLIRFVQVHETFRRPEIEALAVLADINIEFLSYSEYVCSILSYTTSMGYSSYSSSSCSSLMESSLPSVSSDFAMKRLLEISSVETF